MKESFLRYLADCRDRAMETPLARRLRYRYLQCTRQRLNQARPDNRRNRTWAVDAAIREENPQWRKAYDPKSQEDKIAEWAEMLTPPWVKN